jgi:hypothetical protein
MAIKHDGQTKRRAKIFMLAAMQANLYALGAISLWVSLASLGVLLKHIPPFLLTGVSLLMGSLLALPFVIQDRRQWQVPASTLARGAGR